MGTNVDDWLPLEELGGFIMGTGWAGLVEPWGCGVPPKLTS